VRGILSLGVQILTIEEVTLSILKDAVLRKKIVSLLEQMIESFKNLEDRTAESQLQYSKLIYLIHDLKYMSKPLAIPSIVHETDLLDKLLGVFRKFYLADMVSQSMEMDQYDHKNIKFVML
jgi:hypothetical protein